MLRSLSLLALATCALCASAQSVVFYGGDPALGPTATGTASERNGAAFVDFSVYDDFTLTTQTRLTGLFGDYEISGGAVTGLSYEIRQGVAQGNGGTLLFSGAATGVARVPTGQTAQYPISRLSGDVAAMTLAPGTYWLGLFAVMSGGDAFVELTNGANGVGTPLNDGNAYVNSERFGIVYDLTSHHYNDPLVHDYSYGVVGQPVPEPSVVAALGLCALALLRRRRCG